MERTAKAVIERSRYEDKYGVEVTQDEVTGQTSVRDREKDEVELAKEQARNSLMMLDLGPCWHNFICVFRQGVIHLLRSQNFRDFGPPPPLFAFWAES